ncbi:sporulation protein [Psychrobium sp. 1_MG-2023]|uniref:sporulation protein n=1 Tax=Psychrobium sp. 1_MG-2023 TaxID=3062624 RepID=UPI000C327055|nr:sporulation protein [Psychrobium sp. 1_MG-2023]MDP2559889.1 sporulation protein [Psychrobium sp. 1_MG-2023]PKF59010.1 sporulation protein [Alteromonadales bacterium alter-6D02]
MSFFKKVLSSVGIGSATVDTIIDNPQLAPGESLVGYVAVKGGSTEQAINHIAVAICCNYFSEETYTETDEDGEETEHTRIVEHVAKLTSFKVSDSFTTQAEQELRFDFSVELPFYTPLSLGRCQVWVDTDLDIDFAFDKSDKDYLDVVPSPRQSSVLTAMSQLGFVLAEVECEKSSQLGQPFVQEFEFEPQGGEFRGRVDEVEMLMVSHPEQLEILVEVDRKARGLGGFFSELLGRDESKLWVDINDFEQEQVTEILHQAISHHC